MTNRFAARLAHLAGVLATGGVLLAGLPGLASSRCPVSTMSPSVMNSPTRSEIVTRVRPVLRAISARLCWPAR